jgi:ElaB/YqjD/DUF883 family membrane-anchored ribosome-binding protein
MASRGHISTNLIKKINMRRIAMKNLGKIVIFLIFFANILNASVTAKVEPKYVYAGDTATYMLTISGNNVKKPLLLDICGNDIVATGSQTSIQSINGNYQKSYTLTYDFVPQKNCTIAPVDVSIDSKIEKSNSVNVEVKPRVQDKNAEFILSFKTSKSELFVGEPFTLTLFLKQRKGAQAVDSKFIAPEFKGFWKKSESQAQRTEDSDYIITKVVYELAPQREGKLTISPAQLKIATRSGRNNWGTFMPQVQWRTYYSNSVSIKAKALPNNAKLVGDFKLSAIADKKVVHQNEAVNVTVTVVGNGDLEDIESFKPYMDSVNIFDEKIEIKGNKLTQKLVFVGDEDFTIPSFELVFFNTKTQKVQKIKTEPISVKVSGSAPTKELKIKRDENNSITPQLVSKEVVVVKENYLYIALAFGVGLILGVLIMLVKPKSSKVKTSKLNIKDEKVLFVKLLPYKEDAEVASILDTLEKNLYSKSKTALDKKVLKEVIKRYSIS